MSKVSTDSNYASFLISIKEEIKKSRLRAARTVNRELIDLYWKIGEMIVQKQENLGWGKSVVERLSKDICVEFNGIKGFSPRNLWDMKRFFETYSGISNLRQVVAEIPWGHNLLILNKLKNRKEREYYIQATIENGWSRNVLLNQIKAGAYTRHSVAAKTHNFTSTLPDNLAEQADDVLKDAYVLDFLGISKPVQERELENRMVERIRDVLIEFGKGFAFIGSQYRLSVKGKEYFIDLLFFHRKLKCLVAIELKSGEFLPEYAGKMNFYLNLLDDFVREEGENPSIGIVLCAEKDNFEVEYSLRGINKPVGVSEFYLTKELPAKYKKSLPSPEMIRRKLLEKSDENSDE